MNIRNESILMGQYPSSSIHQLRPILLIINHWQNMRLNPLDGLFKDEECKMLSVRSNMVQYEHE